VLTELERYERATAALDPPFAVIDLTAFYANAQALTTLAAGKPIRVASKSIRCRHLLRETLRLPGFSGVMAYALPEALWLAQNGQEDILVAYPTADRTAIAALADETTATRITLMVDHPDHLDLISAALPASHPPVRVCLELDTSWRLFGGRVHLGARRSGIHTPDQAATFAQMITRRPGFRLVGLMAYEAHIAGIGDAPPSRIRGALIRAFQSGSYAELRARRAAAVAAVQAVAPLEFVNAGGTGSIARSATEPCVTEVTAGSGLYGPTLFDHYRAWRPQPAALFALPVVRRPAPGYVTVLGGGWIASGPTRPDRAPLPWLPRGLRLTSTEGAGEVQTPLRGPGATTLRVGDRVWFRHAKAGELCEHVTELHLIDGDRIVDTVPTYRGEGRAFL